MIRNIIGWLGRLVDFLNLRKQISSIWKGVNLNRRITILINWISINLRRFLLRNRLLISMIMTTQGNHQILPWTKYKNWEIESKKIPVEVQRKTFNSYQVLKKLTASTQKMYNYLDHTKKTCLSSILKSLILELVYLLWQVQEKTIVWLNQRAITKTIRLFTSIISLCNS